MAIIKKCVCGQEFPDMDAYRLHTIGDSCEFNKFWNEIGREVLKDYMRNKHGSYIILTPGVLATSIVRLYMAKSKILRDKYGHKNDY